MVWHRHRILPVWLTVILSVGVYVCHPSDVGAALPKITGISLVENGDELQVRVAASAPVRYERVDLRADWIVVDVKGAQLGIPVGAVPNSRGPIQRIRIAQFSPDTVRLVVELDQAVRSYLSASPDRRAIMVGIPGAAKKSVQSARSQSTSRSAAPPPEQFSIQVAPPQSSAQVTPPRSSGQVTPPQSSGQVTPPQSSAPGYVLGPDDVLEIRVWGYPDLTTVAAVRPDGNIAIPLAGTIPAGGVGVGELTQRLTRAYAEYIVDPQVTVIIKEFRKIRISVLGQVAHPGTYGLMPGARLLDAVSAAGGVTDIANLQEARLVQQGRSPQAVNLERVLAGDPQANIILGGNETLVVAEDLTNVVSVAGEVAHPGRFRLKGEMRVLDALLMAGGLNERASVTEARLTRASGEQPPFDLQQLMLHQDMNQNVVLRPGDTLFVPEDTRNKIYVVGDVNHPGVFPLKGPVTLLQAIAMAGGPTQHGIGTAKTAHIVRRNEEAAPNLTASTTATSVQRVGDRGVLMTVDLRAMMKGDLSKDEPLRPGDVVVVPETGLSALPLILQVIGTIFLGFRL